MRIMCFHRTFSVRLWVGYSRVWLFIVGAFVISITNRLVNLCLFMQFMFGAISMFVTVTGCDWPGKTHMTPDRFFGNFDRAGRDTAMVLAFV